MIHAADSTGARRLALAVAGLAVAGLVLGACSSGTTSGSSSSSSSSTSGSGGGSSLSAQLQAIADKVQSGKGATFKATYSSTGSSSTQTIVFEQKPPKTYFSAGSGSAIINDGTTTYTCDTSSSPPSCVATGSAANPLVGLFTGTTITAFLQTARAQEAAHLAGYNLTYSDASYAGQASHCITATGPSGSGKYCVTDSGIIAYVNSGSGNVFELTDYTTNVSDSDFQVPAGATTQTLPPGVSIP